MIRDDFLSLQQRRTVHQVCWQFETDWQDGKAPSIEEHAGNVDVASRSTLLAELMTIELELRLPSLDGKDAQQEADDTKPSRDDLTLRLVAEFEDRFPDNQALVSETVERFKATHCSRTILPQDDRYEFLREIDRGGAGVVWRVFDRHLKRDAAVKLLLDSQNSPDMRQRLEQEARLCGRLQHPGIVPIHELSRLDDGRPFMTMKLIEGLTLAEMLESDPPNQQTALLAVFREAVVAVAYAHQRGIIHRDLKPANIMVGEFDEVQVMDWGLGKQLEDDNHAEPITDSALHAQPNLTLNGSVFGTLAYMSPEQARGDVDRIDKRSDVFSLGGILCRILTENPPYSGDDSKTLWKEAREADLSSALERLAKAKADPQLILLAKQCLSVDPEERPADAGQLSSQLDAILKPARLQRVSGKLAALLCVAVLVVAVGVAFFRSNRDTLAHGPDGQRNASVETSTSTNTDLLRTAQRQLTAGQAEEAEALLRPLMKSDVAPELSLVYSEALKAVGKPEEQQQQLRDLVAKHPHFVQGHRELGNAYLHSGDHISAEDAYRNATTLLPDDEVLRSSLVEVLLQNEKSAEAREAAKKGLPLTPDAWNVHLEVGISCLGVFELDEAFQFLQQAILLDPDHPGGHYWLGEALLEQERFAEAMEAFKQAKANQAKRPNWKQPRDDRMATAARYHRTRKSLRKTVQRPIDSLTPVECFQFASYLRVSGRVFRSMTYYRQGFSESSDVPMDVLLNHREEAITKFLWRYLPQVGELGDRGEGVAQFAVTILREHQRAAVEMMATPGEDAIRGEQILREIIDSPMYDLSSRLSDDVADAAAIKESLQAIADDARAALTLSS